MIFIITYQGGITGNKGEEINKKDYGERAFSKGRPC
jgi:hypothetical protein